LLGIIKDGGMEKEKELHKKFESYRIHGEWFEATPILLTYIENSTQ